jgi:hypothetical protein
MTVMLVAVTGLGSVWRRRFGKDANDPKRFVRGAYYNTTGISIGGHTRQRPKIVGCARFNGNSGFNPNYASRIINRVFECAAPCIWQGQNKLLFERMLSHPEPPDRFLVVVRPEITGPLTIGSNDWRSSNTWLIAFSEDGSQQEAMLLMPPKSWLRTALGTFVLEPSSIPWIAKLQLQAK